MLNERSKQIRRDTIDLSGKNGGYHYGGCFSIVEILIALYDNILTGDDRFILSKGHSCWPYYVILRERGFDPKLEGHPARDPHNGIHCSTGSLGHGLPMGIGMAMAKKFKNEPGNVYVLMGDGECQEGTTWESMLIATHHKLDNLVVIVDWNGCQGSGYVNDVLPLKRLLSLAEGIGFDTHTVDGHSVDKLTGVMQDRNLTDKFHEPMMIIAETVKGKGASFMENKPEWHAKWLDPKHKELALMELR